MTPPAACPSARFTLQAPREAPAPSARPDRPHHALLCPPRWHREEAPRPRQCAPERRAAARAGCLSPRREAEAGQSVAQILPGEGEHDGVGSVQLAQQRLGLAERIDGLDVLPGPQAGRPVFGQRCGQLPGLQPVAAMGGHSLGQKRDRAVSNVGGGASISRRVTLIGRRRPATPPRPPPPVPSPAAPDR